MLATIIGFSVRVWIAPSNPDSDVHTSGGATPDIGEFFMNTSTGELFLCIQTGSNNQTWNPSTNNGVVQTLINAIPQADWLQANTSASNFIKNKPSIPNPQIQSDWTQINISSLDFIKNKPTLSTVATTGAYSDLSGKPTLSTVAISGAYADLTGKPILATVATSGSYNDLSNKPNIPAAQVQSDWTQANSSSVDFIKNKPTIPSGQIQSDWTQTNSASVDFIKNKPAARSQSSATRALNTAFQVSATRWSTVRYSVDISTTVSLSGSQIGRVILEMATDAAFTTGVQSLASFGNGNSGTLVVGLVLTQLCTACLSGDIPPGYYVRLRTVNTTGTPTFTYQVGQEVLI